MMKRTLIPLLLLSLVVTACGHKDSNMPGPSGPGTFTYYDMPLTIEQARLFENTPVVNRFTSMLYTIIDRYTDKFGVEQTDSVKGLTAGDHAYSYGNYDLSLYGKGLSINKEGLIEGSGSVLCFHIASANLDALAPGQYTFSNDPDAGTFTANVMLSYKRGGKAFSNGPEATPANVTDGELRISFPSAKEIKVEFDLTTSIGTKATGEYTGPYSHVETKEPVTSKMYEGSYAGQATIKSILSEFKYEFIDGSGNIVRTVGPSADLNNPGFLSFTPQNLLPTLRTIFGNWKIGVFAKNSGANLSDWQMALTYDLETQKIELKSPIEMSSFLWHNRQFDLPNNTLFMKAPDTFTDSDFEKINETTGLNFDMKPERLFLMPDEKTFVFFVSASGDKGVLRINSVKGVNRVERPAGPNKVVFTEPAEVTLDYKFIRTIYPETFDKIR